MAPEHSGPRSTLASLYQQLGQPQMALQVLSGTSCFNSLDGYVNRTIFLRSETIKMITIY